ncbi:MAG: hypothetical protein DYH13_00605 [Alphaproteobacteria bacterium PRO2]|nr:hypothetical protein [Alphaproteobacteria bacterium PRO2]
MTEARNAQLSEKDHSELIALYDNATKNVMYFKGRLFWMMTTFIVATFTLWSELSKSDSFLNSYVDFVLGYYLLLSLWFIIVCVDWVWKTQHHRQKIDRCAGFDTDLNGHIPKSGRELPGFGNVFFYARTGKPRSAAEDKNMVAYRDFGDKMIGIAAIGNIILFAAATIHVLFPKTDFFMQYFSEFSLFMIYFIVALILYFVVGYKKSH